MKKVILPQPKQEPVISINKVSADKYYGLSDGAISKAFVTASSYEGPPLVVCCNGLTIGNSWSIFDKKKNLNTCLQTAIEEGFEVYEFNTSAELFNWLAE